MTKAINEANRGKCGEISIHHEKEGMEKERS